MTAWRRTPGSSAAPKRLFGPRAPFATQRRSPNPAVKRLTIRLVSPRRCERMTRASVCSIATPLLRWNDDAARDDHLDRLLDAERGVDELVLGAIDKGPGGRVRGRRDEDAVEGLPRRLVDRARRFGRHEPEAVDARPGKLDEHDLLERRLPVAQEGLADLLQRAVDGAEHGNAEEHRLED